jgi:hypothetical protein
MAEYVLLLAASTGAQVLASVDRTLREDTLLWVGAAVVVLLVAGWLLKPRRW